MRKEIGVILLIGAMLAVPSYQYGRTLYGYTDVTIWHAGNHYYLNAVEHVRAQELAAILALRPDLITTVGFNYNIREAVGDPTQVAPSKYLAIGTGTTAANIADTGLQTEITTNGGQRVSATYAEPATKQWSISNLYTFTGSFAITEIAAFNSITVGCTNCMLDHIVFSAVNVVSGDTFTPTITFTES